MHIETELEMVAQTDTERFVAKVLDKLGKGELLSQSEGAYLAGLYAGTLSEALELRAENARLRRLLNKVGDTTHESEDGDSK